MGTKVSFYDCNCASELALFEGRVLNDVSCEREGGRLQARSHVERGHATDCCDSRTRGLEQGVLAL